MKKYLIPLMILIITFSMFTSCDTQVYHTVTFDYDTDGVEKYTIIVKDGQILYSPKDPEKDNAIFDGWEDGNGNVFSFSTPIKEDITIKARWIDESTVTIKDSSGTVIRKSTVKLGSDYSFPTNLGYYVTSYTDGENNSLVITNDSIKITKVDMVIMITGKGKYADYAVGDVGPGGGYIIYDADNPSGESHMISQETSATLGWRYIEMAPENLKNKYAFGYYRTSDDGVNNYVNTADEEYRKIGSGKTNTAALIEKMENEAYLSESGSDKGIYAALAAAQYDGGGYSDWFLPSANEVLSLMYDLSKSDKVNITKDATYWTSTEEGGALKACSAYINDAAAGGPESRSIEYLVRPFRYF